MMTMLSRTERADTVASRACHPAADFEAWSDRKPRREK